MESAKFKIIEKKDIYRGRVINLDVCKIELPDGKILEREIVKHSGAVVIIPLLENGDLVLIDQLRCPTGGFIWEFPAGTLGKNETPLECAHRELEEEIGYKAGELKELLSFYTTPGFSTEYMHLFLASDLKKTESKLEEDECLESKVFSSRKVDEMIKKGEIIDAKTILSFLYYIHTIAKDK